MKDQLTQFQEFRARALRRLFGPGSRFVMPGDVRHEAFVRIIDRYMRKYRHG